MLPIDFAEKAKREEAEHLAFMARNPLQRFARIANNLPAPVIPFNPANFQIPMLHNPPINIAIPNYINPMNASQQHNGAPTPQPIIVQPGFVNADPNIPQPRFDPPVVQRRPVMRQQGSLIDTELHVNNLSKDFI